MGWVRKASLEQRCYLKLENNRKGGGGTSRERDLQRPDVFLTREKASGASKRE